jgi:hypothetical protein
LLTVVLDTPIDSPYLRDILKDRPADCFLAPDNIADAYYHIAMQKRGAWTHELDLRPWGETF